MKKLFRIFEWQDPHLGIGQGQTQTYLMAENKTEAIREFGENEDIQAPWYGYGAEEKTMEDFALELEKMLMKMEKINILYNELNHVFNDMNKYFK